MEGFKAFLKRKDIEISVKRYLIDALGAMAQGLFCSLLIGTIIKTLGQQTGVSFLTDIGAYAMAVSGPAMAVAIGYALKADPMVLFSLAAVGWASNAEGGAGGPLAVLIIAIVAAECGKAVSKETKIDILVTPIVTILVGLGLSYLIAAPIGAAAS
ncbi:MAG: PTS sugar transporter subunit IIC, partial [Lachnospiraceae bacterium]|nr:PTS sugar transporter subunit IIC [Lachnospiraceae bacterium]